MVAIFNNDNVRDAGVFLSRQLEQRMPKVYERKYPAFRFGNGELLPLTFDLEVGADSIVEEILDTVGVAGDGMADQVDDIPLADANINESKFGVVVKPIAIRYSVRELAAAQKANRNIKGMRELAARRAIEETMNSIAATGDRTRGLTGLLNNPLVDIDSSISTNYYADTVTADDLVNLFSRQISKIITSTKMTEEPDTILVPVALHEALTMKRLGDSGMTAKSFILENSTWIRDIRPCNEVGNEYLKLKGVIPANSTKDSILIYPRNPDVVHRMAEPLTVLPPQLRGLVYVVIMFQATTGAMWHYPKSALRVEIPMPA